MADLLDFDPGFRFAEAGLRFNFELVDQLRIGRGWTRNFLMARAGYKVPGASATWYQFMHPEDRRHPKTMEPVRKVARALGVQAGDLLTPIEGWQGGPRTRKGVRDG